MRKIRVENPYHKTKKKGTGLLPRPAKARKKENPMAKHRKAKHRSAKARMAYARSFIRKAKRKRSNPVANPAKKRKKVHKYYPSMGATSKVYRPKKRRAKSKISRKVVRAIKHMVFHPAPDAIPVHRRKGVVRAHIRRVNPKYKHRRRRRHNPFGLSRVPIQNLIIKSMIIVGGLVTGTKITQFYARIPLINKIPTRYLGIINLLAGTIGAIKLKNDLLKTMSSGIAIQGAYDLIAQNFGQQIGIKPMEGDDEFLGYQPMFGNNLFSGENIDNLRGENVDNLRGDVVHLNGEVYNVLGDDDVTYGDTESFLGDLDV